MEKHQEIENAKLMLAKMEVERDLLNKRISWWQEQIAKLEWEPITWDDLEYLIKIEYYGSDYHKNPMVAMSGGRHKTYCFIAEDGKLQVGPFYDNDKFPRGEPLFIHYNREPFG